MAFFFATAFLAGFAAFLAGFAAFLTAFLTAFLAVFLAAFLAGFLATAFLAGFVAFFVAFLTAFLAAFLAGFLAAGFLAAFFAAAIESTPDIVKHENAHASLACILSDAHNAHVDLAPVDLEINSFGLFPPLERFGQRFQHNVCSHGFQSRSGVII